MFENKKAIIFDLDGTIVDSAGLWEEVDKLFIKSFNKIPSKTIREEADNFFHTTKSKKMILGYMKFLKIKYNLPGTALELHQHYKDFGRKYAAEHIKLKKDVDIFIKELYNKKYIIALATLSSKGNINAYFNENKIIKETLDWNKIFKDRILDLSSVKRRKPHPDIYLETVKMLNLKKEECIVIEDSYTGVLAAVRANLDVINIYDKYSNSKRELINKITTYKVNNYQELINELK